MKIKKKIAFHTLGCKLNFSETSSITKEVIKEGFEVVEFKEHADVYVIHSCTVTHNADKKTIYAVRQAHRRNSDAHIAVLGCYSQLKPDEIARIDGVDIVLGNIEKFDLVKYLQKINGSKTRIVHTNEINDSIKFIPSYSLDDRTRSFFKIQDGCDNFCSYCAVPFARGRSRSNTIYKTIEIAKEIAKTQMKEVILTGVNIGDFGRKNNETFLDLLLELDKIEGIERFRISSIEPDLLSDGIIEFVAHSKKFQPHFHIPLQSGSDKILKAMHRHYERNFFADRVEKIKSLMPECCIAADIIVGLPGETDEDFEEAYNFIEGIDISYIHVFTYSERENTLAAKSNEMIPVAVRNKRSEIFHKLSEQKKEYFYRQNIGRKVNVLFESDNDRGFMQGFSGNYIRVKTRFDRILINQIVEVELKEIDKDGIFIMK